MGTWKNADVKAGVMILVGSEGRRSLRRHKEARDVIRTLHEASGSDHFQASSYRASFLRLNIFHGHTEATHPQ
jgi:hypothetical protein